MGTVINQIHWN